MRAFLDAILNGASGDEIASIPLPETYRAAVVRKDTDRDKILTAAEAKEYGIIDTVLEYRKLSASTA